MRLAKVEYEFFDFEDPSGLATELARQVHLVFSDAPALFLSWTSERQYGPDSEHYSIGSSATSFFLDEPASVVDASKSPCWAKHLGQDLELAHIPSPSPGFEHQVIEVRSNAASTFVYSLGLDKIQVSSKSPISSVVTP